MAQLITSDGTVANNYVYGPFNELTYSTETITNPFHFIGQFGVMDEGNGLSFMRARIYDAPSGHYFSRDPMGMSLHDAKLNSFAAYDPSIKVDTAGLQPLSPCVMNCVGAAFFLV